LSINPIFNKSKICEILFPQGTKFRPTAKILKQAFECVGMSFPDFTKNVGLDVLKKSTFS